MAESFSALKNSRKSNLAKLQKEADKINNPQTASNQDDRFWKPELDKSGSGYAVIRFLPAPEGEDMPWVRIFNHGFQGPGGWYIENSLTTLGQKDPLGEYNSFLWNSGLEANKEVARKQKRRLSYISNIYVVEDKANPQNEGKVFLYRFGKKIFDKITSMMNPEFDDEQPIEVFDLWEGANFKLKIRKVDGYSNYDKSEFTSPAPLFDDDAKLEKVWNTEYPLQEFLDPKNFKSYDELKKRLDIVLGNVESPAASAPSSVEDASEDDDSPWHNDSTPSRSAAPAVSSSSYDEDEDEDDNLDYFKKLAEA